MNTLRNQRKHHWLFILLMSFLLALYLPSAVRAETNSGKASSALSAEEKETPSRVSSEENERIGADPSSSATDAAREEKASAKEDGNVEEGESLEVEPLAKAPLAVGSPRIGADGTIEVDTFTALQQAIVMAGEKQTTIKIVKSIAITEALTIGEKQDIILTAANERVQAAWKPIQKPADFAGQGESAQRAIIKEGRRRGEEALAMADKEKNPLPSAQKGDILLTRDAGFAEDTLFYVRGKLTLGTGDSALYIDGNGNAVRTQFDNRGSVIDVDGTLLMKNAIIMNSYNRHGYTGSIRLNSGAKFIMEGGRISGNTSYEQVEQDYTRPYAAGAVYVKPGATFEMKNGLIDNNEGGLTGGVFAGDLWGASGDPAVVTMTGGIIAGNLSATRFQMGAGINGFPKSKVTITDGIIAGNKSFGVGGGIGISSQYIGSPVNILGKEKASVNTDYQKFLKTNKAEAHIDGGLLYKNVALASGGGIYVDSNDVHFGKTMILDNTSTSFGGGIYISFPPLTQKIENMLITENVAQGGFSSSILGGSNGGGLWNCPTGFVHIGDGHSVYVYNNDAKSYGKDITFTQRTWFFQLNGVNLEGEFYSHISPVTKEKNIIKFLEDGPNKEKGVEIPEHLSYHTMYTHLKAIYSEKLIAEAWKNAQTFLLGNTARNGGGFGSDANVTTPKDDGDYALEVDKKWDEKIKEGTIPQSIKADVFLVPKEKDAAYVKANYGKDNTLFKYGEITLSKENGWHSRLDTNYFSGANKQKMLDALKIKNFSDIGLPDDAYQIDKGLPFTAEELAAKGYKYLVVEQGDDYFVEVTEEKPAANETSTRKSSHFTLTNYPFGRIEVEKRWTNIEKNDVPTEIEVYLLLDASASSKSMMNRENRYTKNVRLRQKSSGKTVLKNWIPGPSPTNVMRSKRIRIDLHRRGSLPSPMRILQASIRKLLPSSWKTTTALHTKSKF